MVYRVRETAYAMSMLKKVERPSRPRMTDVAAVAGVSLKSVSRVLNREPYVSSDLRRKVERAIAELQYVPHDAARALASGRSLTVGILFDNPSPSYTIAFQQGAYGECRKRGYHLRIDNLDATQEDAAFYEHLDTVIGHRPADGFIVTPPLTDDLRVLEKLESDGIPYVRVAPVVQLDRAPMVEIDDYAAAVAVADYLVAEGHRRFAVVSGPALHGRAAARTKGFTDRLHAIMPEVEVLQAPGSFSFQSGMEAGQRLEPALACPMAIFATNDEMAVGLMSYLARIGRKVPDDVSVCGFDDSTVSLTVWPHLTTVRQPIAELGIAAVRMILDEEAAKERRVCLETSIIVRGSVGSVS